MINKQNLWFLTLFSLILVLGVYYLTMPNNLLKDINIKTAKEAKKQVVAEVLEENALTAMRVSKEEERQEQERTLKEQLTKKDISTEEKNNAYEQLKNIKELQGKEEFLEKQIKKEFKIDCFTKIENSNINLTCISKNHDTNLANNLMRKIQGAFKTKMNIRIKFQKD